MRAVPGIRAESDPAAVMEAISTASKRGRMPGFRRTGDSTFEVALFGSPFDRMLVGRIEAAEGGAIVRFDVRTPPLLPWIFAVLLIVSIWPGIVLVDHLIPGDWGWWPTWWWYLPLTIIPTPFTWQWAMKKTDATTYASSQETLAAIAKEVGGRIETR